MMESDAPEQSLATRTPADGLAETDIRLEQVTKRFGDTLAVDRLDLSIERGAFFAMLGPSGCGKTTTLRMIGGFEDPTEGRVLLGGEDITDAPPYRRDVNTVFQSYALFPHLSVERNVAFGLERRGLAKAEVRRRVGETLELVQLRGLALLLDEPLGALDLRLRKQLQLELKRIQQDVGITFVHVTHDQEEAMTMADRIAVMCDGRIEQAGGAAELYERPRTEFVANFLGVSNLVDGRLGVTTGALTAVTTHDGAELLVPAERVGPHDGDDVRIGVRPEKITMLPPHVAPPDGANLLRGTVTVAAFLGVSIQYLVRAVGGEELTVVSQNAEGAEPESFGVGREVQLAWNPHHTFAVAKESPR
jgi:spermidine/putrescine transport system ATP-binding protein